MSNERFAEQLNEKLTRHYNILEYNFGSNKDESLSEQEDEEFDLNDATGEGGDEEGGDEEGGDEEGGDETEETEEEPSEDDLTSDEEGGDEEEFDATTEEQSEEDDENVKGVDVTDLVNNQEELEQQTSELTDKVTNVFDKINGLYDKIGKLEDSVGNMDNLLNQIQGLEKQVKMMQPLTPDEEKEEMAEKSYPYNTTLEDYEEENKSDTQSDMEKKDKTKLDWKDVMRDYNENQIRNSFNSFVDEDEK